MLTSRYSSQPFVPAQQQSAQRSPLAQSLSQSQQPAGGWGTNGNYTGQSYGGFTYQGPLQGAGYNGYQQSSPWGQGGFGGGTGQPPQGQPGQPQQPSPYSQKLLDFMGGQQNSPLAKMLKGYGYGSNNMAFSPADTTFFEGQADQYLQNAANAMRGQLATNPTGQPPWLNSRIPNLRQDAAYRAAYGLPALQVETPNMTAADRQRFLRNVGG